MRWGRQDCRYPRRCFSGWPNVRAMRQTQTPCPLSVRPCKHNVCLLSSRPCSTLDHLYTKAGSKGSFAASWFNISDGKDSMGVLGMSLMHPSYVWTKGQACKAHWVYITTHWCCRLMRAGPPVHNQDPKDLLFGFAGTIWVSEWYFAKVSVNLGSRGRSRR